MTTPSKPPARGMFTAHIAGIVLGQVLGTIAVAYVKRHVIPHIDSESALAEALGKFVRDLPQPEGAAHRPSRTGSAVPADS